MLGGLAHSCGAGLHARKKSFLAEDSCLDVTASTGLARTRWTFPLGPEAVVLKAEKKITLRRDYILFPLLLFLPQFLSWWGAGCHDQPHGLVLALSFMHDGVGHGSSKQKSLFIPSTVVKSLQISIWWERALGRVERRSPRTLGHKV